MSPVREQQVKALYRAALERPAAERSSFVTEITGDDIELRRSIELLLSQHDATDVGARSTAPRADAPELQTGAIVGHYRIDGILGRGGMGIVYRATDTKLNRPVALKFLSAALTSDESRRRFRQEADAASSLNHPHIVTVYDVDAHGDRQFIVSELVDGGTLEDWAARNKRRSWRHSVELVTGVADALAAAHAAGVLHRDVKPSNILIGANGYAKLADFGLAKLVHTAQGAAPAAQRTTRAGVVVGTVAYMSPEQATGQPLDARSDVFSFGVVLYELIAGRRPFESDNELEVLKSIAHAAPAPLPDDVPDLLRMAVDKALEKDPADRYQTMRDLVADLRRVVRKPGSVSKATPKPTRAPWFVAAAVATALAIALIPATAYFSRSPIAPAPRVRFELPIPGYAGNGGLAISPSGEYVAYASTAAGGPRQLWVRPLAGTEARALPGTDNVRGTFWSPDSRQLAFSSDGAVKRVDVAGGTPQHVAAAANLPFPGAWGTDGTLLFTPQSGAQVAGVVDLPIARVPATGGEAAQVTGLVESDVLDSELVHVAPRWLPDGEHFVYIAGAPGATTYRIYASSIRNPGRKLISESDTGQGAVGLAYSDGFLLYNRGNAVVAQPFDTEHLELRGEPTVLADEAGEFSVAAGVFAYTDLTAGTPVAAASGARRLVFVDREGRRQSEVEAPAAYRLPVLAPDGRHLAVSAPDTTGSGLNDIWTVDTERGITTRLTIDRAEDSLALWSPDGDRLVFNSGRDGSVGIPSSLYERAANGAGNDRRLFSATANELVVPFDWSRDGRYILFGRASATSWMERIDLWVLPTSGEDGAYALLDSPFRRTSAKLSPDGRWIAYTTNESGRHQIVVQPFPDVSRGRWQISTRGGIEPRWRDDGREIVYLDPDGVVMSVAVSGDGERFEAAAPQALFATGLTMQRDNEQPEYLYDMTGDGQRFLLNELVRDTDAAAASTTPAMLTVIVNWTTGVAQR